MGDKFSVNDPVITPNGPGRLEGVIQENGVRLPLVRHQVSQMTSITFGRAFTKGAKFTPIFIYTWEEVRHA